MNKFWKGKNVFVTGAGGFIGSHLVIKLRVLGAKVEECKVDLLKNNLSGQNYSKPDYIFHLAAVSPSATDKIANKKIIESNVGITKNVLDWAKSTKAKVLFSSSSHIYTQANIGDNFWKEKDMVPGKALSIFGLSKQASEQLCLDYSKKYNLEILILRISNVYGPGDKSNRFFPTFIKKCLNRNFPLPVFGHRDAERDFIYIDDVVNALTQAVNVIGYTKILNIGSGYGTAIGKVAEIIKFEFGLGNEKLKFENIKDGEATANILDISRAKKIMNFSPAVSLAEGIKKTVNWWKNNIPDN